MAIKIELTPGDIESAEREAARRQDYNTRAGLRGRNKAPSRGSRALELHFCGCKGEIAVAKLLGMEEFLFIDEKPVSGSPDLPCGIDVKTRPKHDYDMLVQLKDSRSKKYVLATVEGSLAIVHGWLPGEYAMLDSYIKSYRAGRPCYAIPQSKLLSMEMLSSLLAGETQGPFGGLVV